MAIWRREHGRNSAPAHTLAILQEIEVDLPILPNTYPQVASVQIGPRFPDSCEFKVQMIIALGIPLLVRYQSVDVYYRNEQEWEDEKASSVACLVFQAVKELQAAGVPALADWFHNLHMRARITLARWQLEGAHRQLIDAGMVWHDHTFNPEAAVIEVRLTGLDDLLRTSVKIIELPIKDSIEIELAD